MKKPNITPGPLFVKKCQQDYLSTYSILTKGGGIVAEGAREPNARLIAAAPQLAEALELALSFIEDLPYPQNWPAEKLRAALLAAGYTE